jgi:hypothetical protein
MTERTTQGLLIAVIVLLAAHLVRPGSGIPRAGNIRLRSADGTVRVKLGASADGSGLLLLDDNVEPAVVLGSSAAGTSLTLSEAGRKSRVIRPRRRAG